MLALLLAALTGLHVPASAQPPQRYRRDAVVVIHYVAPEKVGELCARGTDPKLWGPGMFEACTKDGVEILPNPCAAPRDHTAELTCHELGHANGWPADHPQD